LVRKAIDLFAKIATDEPEKYKEISKLYGNALRIGMLESAKDKTKLAKLLRFESTRSDYTSLEEVRPFSLSTAMRADWLGLSCSTWTTAKKGKSRFTISPVLARSLKIWHDHPSWRSYLREDTKYCS
jgi:heat shock protein beta